MTIGKPERIGKYIVEGELGRGAMGVVYRAVHEYTQREVALKVLSAEVGESDMGGERFRREVSVSARVDDDGIIQVFDAGRIQDTFYYAMELLEGCELADVMGAVDADSGLALLADAAESLGACHDAGIVHRDLKPANIFLPADSPPTKLLDFGVASVRDATRATQSGFTLGTPHYMSPEQARDARSVTPASDVWSLGVIAYEIVTGRMPFEGDSAMNVMLSVVQEPPDSLPESDGISSELREVVDRALCKEPTERISEAGEFARRLRQVERVSEVDPASTSTAASAGGPSIEAYRTEGFEADRAPATDESVGQASTLGAEPPDRAAGAPTREESADQSPSREVHPPTADGGGGDRPRGASFWSDIGLLARVAAGLAVLVVAGVVGIYLTGGGSDADQPRATSTGPDAGTEIGGQRAASLERARRAVVRGRRTGHVAVAGDHAAREVEASVRRLRETDHDSPETDDPQTGADDASSGGRPPAAGSRQTDDASPDESSKDDTSRIGTTAEPATPEESGGRESGGSKTPDDGEPNEQADRPAASDDDAGTDLPDPSTLGEDEPNAGDEPPEDEPAAAEESDGQNDDPAAEEAAGASDDRGGGGQETADEQAQSDEQGGPADKADSNSDEGAADENDEDEQDDDEEPGFIQF
jgi:serine/threonine-protein kinase